MKILVFKDTVEVVGYSATAPFETNPIEITGKRPWSLQAITSGVSANPLVSIMASNDGVNWENYSVATTNMTTPFLEKGNLFEPQYVKFKFDPNANISGTVTLYLNMK